jgi:hypothetical protein
MPGRYILDSEAPLKRSRILDGLSPTGEAGRGPEAGLVGGARAGYGRLGAPSDGRRIAGAEGYLASSATLTAPGTPPCHPGRPQSGGRGSNTTEILAGLARSTVWLGAARSVSNAASASRMTRPHRSASARTTGRPASNSWLKPNPRRLSPYVNGCSRRRLRPFGRGGSNWSNQP